MVKRCKKINGVIYTRVYKSHCSQGEKMRKQYQCLIYM